MVSDTPDPPQTADADDIPAEHRIRAVGASGALARIARVAS